MKLIHEKIVNIIEEEISKIVSNKILPKNEAKVFNELKLSLITEVSKVMTEKINKDD